MIGIRRLGLRFWCLDEIIEVIDHSLVVLYILGR